MNIERWVHPADQCFIARRAVRMAASTCACERLWP